MAINIYLSVNSTYQTIRDSGDRYTNNDNFIIIPVIPKEITVNKPQNVQEFETVSLKKLAFIAPADLKEISWSSFFPCRDYSYVRGERLKALQYVYIIDKWIEQKLPIRLIITGLDDDNPESIYMSSAVSDFNYKSGTDGDLYYDISFKEYPLTEAAEESEDELMSNEYNELLAMINDNKNNIAALMTGYETYDDIPDWGKPTVKYLLDNGFIISEGEYVTDEETGETTLVATGKLNITDQLLKGLVIGFRAGAFQNSAQTQESTDS